MPIIRPFGYGFKSPPSGAGGGGDTPSPSSDWLFNEGSGTTVADEKAVAGITYSLEPTWGVGYAQIDNWDGYWSTPAGTYYNLGDFTIAVWMSFEDGFAFFSSFLALGDGAPSDADDYSLSLTLDSGFGPTVNLSDGVNQTSVSYQQIDFEVDPMYNGYVAGTKTLVIATYQRVGGAANNVLSLHFTEDGSTWYNYSVSNAVLMKQDSGFSLRSKNDTTTDEFSDERFKHFRTSIWDGIILSEAQRQDVWDRGSEGVSW